MTTAITITTDKSDTQEHKIQIQPSQDFLPPLSPPRLRSTSSEDTRHGYSENDDDPEDVLFDSLQTLYEYQPITLTSAGASYTYTHSVPTANPIKITLQTPDPEAANWSLHASSVWIASTQLALGVEFLRLDRHLHRIRSCSTPGNNGQERKLRVLELGAAAGLPSILIAKLYGANDDVSVLATDYPDVQLIQTLTQNIVRNGVEEHCRAAPYAWGSDPSLLFSLDPIGEAEERGVGFDVIIAADTLWNPDLYAIFIDTLQRTLRKDSGARIYLVAGLHTGRYTIDSFLRAVAKAGFRVVEVLEREVMNGVADTRGREAMEVRAKTRSWDVTRAEYEEEKDRRGWVIWIELCWEESRLL